MSNAHNQPAFPLLNEVSWKGMTLLDYYICHAPAEPWSHFKPKMRDKPEPVWCVVVGKQRFEFKTRRDVGRFWGKPFEVGKELCADRVQEEAWEIEYVEQRARQWPIYWALLMLEQREKALS
jgi:hypothetical protein